MPKHRVGLHHTTICGNSKGSGRIYAAAAGLEGLPENGVGMVSNRKGLIPDPDRYRPIDVWIAVCISGSLKPY